MSASGASAPLLEDVAAVVTGATGGIGAATCELLVNGGARVVAVARSAGSPEEVITRIAPDRCCFLGGDVRDRATAEAALERAVKFGARHLALVNNAGIDHVGPLVDFDLAELEEVMQVNFFGALNMLQVLATEMRSRGSGSIVNVTSRLASVGVPGMGGYGATKGALSALTKHAAVELAPHGIAVSEVAPGMTATPLYFRWLNDTGDPKGREADVVSRIPAGRVASPNEVASAIAFLISPHNRYITGVTIPVDGGYTAQ